MKKSTLALTGLILASLLIISCNFISTIFRKSAASPTPLAINPPETSTQLPVTTREISLPPTASSGLPSASFGLTSRLQGEHISALHRSGQTFLTWNERADLSGESYRVYRSSTPITASNMQQANLLYEAPEGSAYFYANRYVGESGQWAYRYLERYVIEDRGQPLEKDTGLLVWTLSPEEIGGKTSSQGYYAVTVAPAGGQETLENGYTLGPLEEGVADPLPVEVPVNVGSRGHVFIQYMDLREWNPTFHAPNEANQYYGLDPNDPKVAHAIQYAYDYVIYEPECSVSATEKVAGVVNLHGWNGNNYLPYTEDPDAWGWCAYKIYPVDTSETWYFGFAQKHDYRQGGEPAASDVIVNYTEDRILRMVYDLVRKPPGPAVDFNRIYIYGHSMGASGTLAMALRYPNVFAAASASEPMTNYRTSGDGGGTDWRSDVSLKWGSLQLNLPVKIITPGNWGGHLQRYNGTGVWDWQNHQQNLRDRQGDEMVPLGVAHGRNDTVIEWATQGQQAYAAFNAARRAWGGHVTDDEHSWLGFQGSGGMREDSSGTPFAGFQVVRDETVPGLSNSSNDLTIPPNAVGGYNQTVSWSSSWNPWDGAPVDTPGKWQVSLCSVSPEIAMSACGGGPAQTVDITPRRLQYFTIAPGAEYAWENHRVSDNSLVASGKITAGADGTVTVKAFAVSPEGNRLVIMPMGGVPAVPTHVPVPTQMTPSAQAQPTFAPPATSAIGRAWPDTSRGIHVFNDQLASSMSDALWQFAASHYAGTQKMARSDADRLRSLNPSFLILNYRLGLGLGYRSIQNGCQPTGDWLLIIDGNDWVQEWPGDYSVLEDWLYHWPEGSQTRVLNCDWGWYLAELNNNDWRTYWHGEVLRQVQVNDADGVFMDSLSVPNYLGFDRYDPPLPEINPAFESAWTARVDDWLTWLQTQPLGNYVLIPNAGSWITSREATNYTLADGVMIEGFAIDADASPYNQEDWQLQMNRALGLINQDKVILAQCYATGAQERMFTLGSYLLIKGNRTYLNIEVDLDPEWWPEYDISIGAPAQSAGKDITGLYDANNRVYRRNFDNGFVLVNPSSPYDGTGMTAKVNLGGNYYLAQTSGGGFVPENGIPTGSVSYQAVNQITLPPYSAAVLLNQAP